MSTNAPEPGPVPRRSATVLVAVVALLASALGGCGADEPGQDAGVPAAGATPPSPAPTTSTPNPSTPTTSTASASAARDPDVEAADRALVAVGSPADGSFAGGRFDYDRPLLRGRLAAEGHLSAVSWDVYVDLDDGQVGAWGAGMDVWDSPRAARVAAEREAGFLSCGGPRRPVALPDAGDRLVLASSCRKPGDDGFRATASAADGVVSRNLTVAARTRALTERGLVAAWASLTAASDLVVASLREG